MNFQVIAISDDLLNNKEKNKENVIKYINNLDITHNTGMIYLLPYDTIFQQAYDLITIVNNDNNDNNNKNLFKEFKNIVCKENKYLLSFLEEIKSEIPNSGRTKIDIVKTPICENYNHNNVNDIIYKKTDKYISLKDKIYVIVENYTHMFNKLNNFQGGNINFLYHIIDDYEWANNIIEELYPIFSLYLLIKKYLKSIDDDDKLINIINLFIKNTNANNTYNEILIILPELKNQDKNKLKTFLNNNLIKKEFKYFYFTLDISIEPLMAFIKEINTKEDYKKVAMKIFVEYLNLTLLFFSHKDIQKFQTFLINIDDIDSNLKKRALVI